jgi:hypothetical protein
MFRVIVEIMVSLALGLYIYNNSFELRTSINEKAREMFRKKLYEDVPETFNYEDLANEYRAPTKGAGREIDEYDGFKKFKDAVFNEENRNPPTGIYTHSSEVEDGIIDSPDIYDHEVAK